MLFFQLSLIFLFLLLNVVYCGIIGIYHELSDTLQNDLQTLVENGKYSVFESVLTDYSLGLSANSTSILWDYICGLKADNDDKCDPFTISNVASVDGNIAFAQLEMFGGIQFSGYWDIIPFTLISYNKRINLDTTTSEITFQIAGVYKWTIGYRGGHGTDIWNAIRVFGILSGTVGISNGASNIGNFDQSQHSFSFFFEIGNIEDEYVIQKGRYDGSTITLPDVSSWNDGSESPATMLAVVEFIGSF